MSLEQDLRESLARRANEIDPSPTAWAGIDGGVRRAKRQMTAAVSLAVVLVVIGGALTASRLVRNNASPGDFAGSGAPTLEPTTSPNPKAPIDTAMVFRHVEEGYSLVYPSSWGVSHFEESMEFVPRDHPGLETGEATFGVAVATTAQPATTNTTVRERAALREETTSDHEHRVTYTIDFSGPPTNCPAGAPCPPQLRGIRVSIIASTSDLWDTYGAQGEAIAQSLGAPDENATGASEVRTKFGSVDAAIKWDPYTEALVRFMDARAAGGGAEAWLCCNATKHYASVARCNAGLYSSCGLAASGYTVDVRGAQQAATVSFLVDMLYRDGSATSDGPGESITVGYESGKQGEGPKVLDVSIAGDGP